MKPINQTVEKMSKEYFIIINQVSYSILKSDINKSFNESLIENLDIKWVRLPSDNDYTTLQKICIQNKSSKALDIDILIHYRVREDHSIPFIYYSPASEAMMLCNKNEYSLIGGSSPYGGPSQYQTNEQDIELSGRLHSLRSVFPPFSQESKGCGMVYHITINGNDQTYLYDWEINHTNLYELETQHVHLKEILVEKTIN